MINEQTFLELSNSTFKQIVENCIYVKKISNSLYGDAEILTHKIKNIQLLLITRIYHRKEQVKKIEAETNVRINLKSDKILRLISYNVRSVNELCGNFYRFQWIYEFSNYTLYDSISQRKKKNQYFTDEELIRLLQSLLQAFQIFKAVSIRHGYIQPKHIIYNPEKKLFCISDIRFMTSTHECKEIKQKTDEFDQCFLSPEALKEIAQSGFTESSNYEKNEVFSIGMLLLNCMLLEYPHVYDKSTREINKELLQQCLQQMNQKYQLTQIVKEMLQFDNYNRPSLDQLTSLLQQFKYKQQYAPQSSHILHIDQSKFSPNQSFEIKYPKAQEITPTRNIDNKQLIKKQSYFTPITHLTHSPVSQIKNDISDISTISQKTYQDPNNNKSITDISLMKDPFNFTYRLNPTPEKKTKPCPSPFRSIALNPITNSQRSNYYTPTSPAQNNSNIVQQQENKQIGYDFASVIKLNVPSSLQAEFQKLDNRFLK